MKYIELKQHLNSALVGQTSFAPIYCIYGDDDCLRSRAVKMFEGVVSPDYADFNLVKIADESGMADAVDALSTFPVFDEYKVVIINLQGGLVKAKKQKIGGEIADVEGDSPAKKLLDEYMQYPSPTSILVAVCESKDIAKSVKYKSTIEVDCSRLDDTSLKDEILEMAQQSPACRMDSGAVDELIVRTQSGMGRVGSEMKKLKDYVNGGVITRQVVCEMVTADLDFKMYELANAISQKDCNNALEILNLFMSNGLSGVTLINLIYGKYRDLLHMSLNKNTPKEELVQLFGVSKPGALYYIEKTASNYSQSRLKQCVDYLHNLQFDVLSGKRNEKSAVHEAVLKLLSI